MVSVREVKNKRDAKLFVEFPLKLYRDCRWFVPPLYADEMKLVMAGGIREVAESVFLLAERDGKVVGRIQGIMQRQFNEINGTKRIRFTRFDSIDSSKVMG